MPPPRGGDLSSPSFLKPQGRAVGSTGGGVGWRGWWGTRVLKRGPLHPPGSPACRAVHGGPEGRTARNRLGCGCAALSPGRTLLCAPDARPPFSLNLFRIWMAALLAGTPDSPTDPSFDRPGSLRPHHPQRTPWLQGAGRSAEPCGPWELGPGTSLPLWQVAGPGSAPAGGMRSSLQKPLLRLPSQQPWAGLSLEEPRSRCPQPSWLRFSTGTHRKAPCGLQGRASGPAAPRPAWPHPSTLLVARELLWASGHWRRQGKGPVPTALVASRCPDLQAGSSSAGRTASGTPRAGAAEMKAEDPPSAPLHPTPPGPKKRLKLISAPSRCR